MGKLLELHTKKLADSPQRPPTDQWFVDNEDVTTDIKELISRNVPVQVIYRYLKMDDIGFPYGQTAFRRWTEGLTNG